MVDFNDLGLTFVAGGFRLGKHPERIAERYSDIVNIMLLCEKKRCKTLILLGPFFDHNEINNDTWEAFQDTIWRLSVSKVKNLVFVAGERERAQHPTQRQLIDILGTFTGFIRYNVAYITEFVDTEHFVIVPSYPQRRHGSVLSACRGKNVLGNIPKEYLKDVWKIAKTVINAHSPTVKKKERYVSLGDWNIPGSTANVYCLMKADKIQPKRNERGAGILEKK